MEPDLQLPHSPVEVATLNQRGAEGYELVGVGLRRLRLRREPAGPAAGWEYRRRISRGAVPPELDRAGWRLAGSWLTFQYFKRRRGAPGAGGPGDVGVGF